VHVNNIFHTQQKTMQLIYIVISVIIIFVAAWRVSRWVNTPAPLTRRDVIQGAINETSRPTGKYVPKFTFPIPGICGDGEIVNNVLKRLEDEGNEEKINYFRKFMDI
jgi:hypothetical protein